MKLTPASKSLGLVIRKAEWLGQGAASEMPTSVAVTLSNDPPPVRVVDIAAAKEEDVDSTRTSPSSLAASSDPASSVPDPLADPLPARAQPSAPQENPEPEVSEHGIAVTFGDRRYRVRGFERNLAVDVMKVNLLAAHGELFHVDTFDLYSAKARGNFIQMAAGELRLTPDTLKSDVGRLLLQLEGLQDQAMAETLKPKDSKPVIDTAAHDAALAYLRSPHLLARIVTDFDACGLVGEATNKLVAYLAAVHRSSRIPWPCWCNRRVLRANPV